MLSYSKYDVGNWYLKISILDGNILIIATSKDYMRTQVGMFTNEIEAMVWVEVINQIEQDY